MLRAPLRLYPTIGTLEANHPDLASAPWDKCDVVLMPLSLVPLLRGEAQVVRLFHARVSSTRFGDGQIRGTAEVIVERFFIASLNIQYLYRIDNRLGSDHLACVSISADCRNLTFESNNILECRDLPARSCGFEVVVSRHVTLRWTSC